MSDWLLEWDDVAEVYRLADPLVYHDAWYFRGTTIEDAVPENGETYIYRSTYSQFRLLPASLITILNFDRSTAAVAYSNVFGLYFLVEANKTYEFEFSVVYSLSNTTYGADFAVNGPAAPTIIAGQVVGCSAATSLAGREFGAYDTGAPFSQGIAGWNFVTIQGILVNGANAGQLHLRFASENVLGTTTVKAGSFVRYRKIN